MPIRTTIPYKFGTFFISFTCTDWLPLIERVTGYDILYNWFDILKSNGHFINGYVIMPNHVHAIISFVETDQLINTIIGNGKRFMAYDIVSRLTQSGELELLELMASNVRESRRMNKKRHEVWEHSFDWKLCLSKEFFNQKIGYTHLNPFVKKYSLCQRPEDYPHSSAKFYMTGEQAIYPVTSFFEMDDVVFAKGADGFQL